MSLRVLYNPPLGLAWPDDGQSTVPIGYKDNPKQKLEFHIFQGKGDFESLSELTPR